MAPEAIALIARNCGDYCTMKLRFVYMFGFGRKSTFWAFQLLVLLFRLYNPRKLFSWQTLHDQTMNNLDFAACETTCVNIRRQTVDTLGQRSVSLVWRSSLILPFIFKCRVGPIFIHLVLSAMFIWTYSYVSYSSNRIFFFPDLLAWHCEAWILELSISIFFDDF